jgi:hypothetical protein
MILSNFLNLKIKLEVKIFIILITTSIFVLLTLKLPKFSLKEYSISSQIYQIDRHLKRSIKVTTNEINNRTKLINANKISDITKVIIDKNVCDTNSENDILVIVFVTIASDEFSRRQTIRQTWAKDLNSSVKSKVIFIIGKNFLTFESLKKT